MTLSVIGAGVGRTGTYSLKLALNQIGVGPCHHMEEVLINMPAQLPLWTAAVSDDADWSKNYDGYNSAVDWPTACFYRELASEYRDAKFILTVRDPDRWVDSFSATIYKLLAGRDEAPQEMRAWLDMVIGVTAKTGFPMGLDRDELRQAFESHTRAVTDAIPADRLLIFQVKDGWEPLCDFLGVPKPDVDFPCTNQREEFWDLVNSNT